MTERAGVVICGAGIAGVAAAYHLAVRHGVRGVVLVDERPPLTLTSDKSTEAYRNWWPGPDGAMVALMNRSIDLLEELAGETGNAFQLNRRGYVYASADPGRITEIEQAAREVSAMGAGPLRIHRGAPGEAPYRPAPAEGYLDQPDGADLLIDPGLIRRHFPYLAQDTAAVLHARRCGWFSGQQMGMLLLEQAKAHGVRFVQARVEAVRLAGGAVEGVQLRDEAGEQVLPTRRFVIAAGPMLKPVGELLGVELPVFSERHLKIAFADRLGAIPRGAPMLIWEDAQRLDWGEEERALLAASPETRALLDTLPAGVHARPEGGGGSQTVLMLWSYHVEPVAEVFPLPEQPHYTEVVLRGMTALVPGMAAYLERLPGGTIDGGYYTKTRENRPLIGPLPVRGAYLIGALSGFGLMASNAAAELLALHLTGGGLPPYARAFDPARYEDSAYLKRLEDWGPSGQL